MPDCCRTCNHRNHDLHTVSSTPSLIDVCIITLSFRSPIVPTNTTPYAALNNILNNILDAADSPTNRTSFTKWSPCLNDARSVVILTTAAETCSSAQAPVFYPILNHLTTVPKVQHVLLDYSIFSLASTSPTVQVPCDLIILNAPNPSIAGAIGRSFGWDPKRSSLSAKLEAGAPAGFSRPGDLVRDFWTWAELLPSPESPGDSTGSYQEGYLRSTNSDENVLRSTNSDEKNMALFYSEDEENMSYKDDETLVMLFQWSSHDDGERFKHPLQKSYGRNGEVVSSDMWDRHVAHPVRQLDGIGAKVEQFRLELRGVEERLQINNSVVEARGSRRLSVMATEIGERVTGLWR